MLRTALHTQLNRVQTFLAVVDFGSFTKAADFLGISKAMASQHVKALEQALGVTLLARSTRAIAPTETGQGFYDDFKVIVSDVEGAFDSVLRRHNGLAGKLRISTTGEYGERFILPLIPLFAERYPALSISYDTDSSLSDLIAERLDLVVRLGALPDSNLRSRQLAEYDIVLVAAPAFLARHAIERPEELADTPWIANSNLQSPTAWTLHSAQAGSASVAGRAAYQSMRPMPSGRWPVPGWAWRCCRPGWSSRTWPMAHCVGCCQATACRGSRSAWCTRTAAMCRTRPGCSSTSYASTWATEGAAHGSRPMPRRMTPVTVCTACSNAMSDSASPSLSRVTWKPKSA